MSLVTINNLTFAYEGSFDNIFENATFKLDTEWKLGFIGRNGRGKTTFMNLLMGKHSYEGSINAATDFEYFPFNIKDKSITSQEIADNINPSYEYWELLRELSILDMDPEILIRPFDTLSNGEQTKLLLAALFLKENCFLLIDEPTNHLDANGRAIVSKYLQGKKGFILVSHDREFLDTCIDHVISINRATIQVQKGNFSSWQNNKINQDNYEIVNNQRLKEDISRLNEAARRTSDWSNKVEKTKTGTKNSGLKPDKGYIGHKAAKMMQRAKNIDRRIESAIDEKSRLLKDIETSESLKLAPLEHHSKKLVEANELSIYYGEKIICNDISFIINRGDRIAFKGKNGCGKTSLIKLICGENIEYKGNIRIASNLIISYVSQDTSMLEGNLKEYALSEGIDISLFMAILRKLDFDRVQFEKNIRSFSEGQKKKVLIAKSLCQKSHLYIWDEPLNYIDLLSRIQIEELLLEYCPTLIFVEHDAAFVKKIATGIVNL